MGFLTDWLRRSVSDADMEAITSPLAGAMYYKDLALQIAKSYIANTISKCEFKVYEGGEEKRNELYYALNIDPNPNQNSSQFINQMINTLYDKNEVLVIPIKNRLYVADGFSVDERPLKENIYTSISIEKQSISKSFRAGDVFHFKLDSQSTKRMIDCLYDVYGKVIASAISAYQRGNGQKYKLIMDSMKAGDKDFVEKFNTTIKAQLQTFIENDNTVFPQFKGTDLQTIGNANQSNSNDVIALRKEVFEIVAQSLKIPMPMMYGNITNMQEIVKVYLTFCIDPLADMIEEEITRKTNTFATWQGGKNFVTVDTSKINHIDLLDVAEKVDKLISSGVCSIDELREIVDKQPLNTEFSQKHWITKNYSDIEDMETNNMGVSR